VTPGLFAAKLALGPLLLPQARWLRRNALRLPEAAGERHGQVGEGTPRLRVLVVGDSSAAGVGVADQAQALALPLAHRLHERLGAAVGWQLVARTGVNTAEANEMLLRSKLTDADVLVTALGVNDVSSQVRPAKFVEAIEQLWQTVRGRTGARWGVFCGLPPMHMLTAVPQPLRWYLGGCSDALDTALKIWTAERGLGYLSLRWASDPAYLAADGFHPGPKLYPQWADRLAQVMLPDRPKSESA